MAVSLLDFLFPRRSLTGKEGVWITADERRMLSGRHIVLDTKALRAKGWHHIDRIVAAAEYKDLALLKEAIHRYKYGRVREMSGVLADLLVQASGQLYLGEDVGFTPVPLHWTRRFSRGFNQSELLAEALVARRGGKVLLCLRRVRPTGSQVKRGREARLVAVHGAFRFVGTQVPASVVLIDDLSTTGATLDACAAALKKAGVKCVQGLVVAHG